MTPPEATRPLLNRFLFWPPDPPGKRSPGTAGLEYRRLDIETADAESLRGWWIKARTRRRRGHLIFFHGNAEDISDCIADARLLAGIGFDVLLFDYRGYGGNDARPSEEGTYLDAEAALDCMLAQPRINRERIFYFGRSLGGAIALKLALEHPPAGLILFSTFASVRDLAPAYIPAALVPDAYPCLTRIKDLHAPLLILHGDEDQTVPLAQAEKLYGAAREPKKMHVFRGYDHNDAVDEKELTAVIVDWHKGLGAVTTSDPPPSSPPADLGSAVIRVDRQHALRVTGDAAAELLDTLGSATKEGARLARAARPGDVFELVPPADLAKGIKAGTLRAATPKRGDASVLVKNVTDGQIAGKSDLQRVKPSAAKIIGPAAWQAMALATQQHYMVEISSKLDGIQASVGEVLARLVDDRIGTLNHISELAAGADAAVQRDGMLRPERVAELRQAAADAKREWHQVLTSSRRQFAQYQKGEISAEEVEQTFALLAHATRVLAQCSDALVAIPRATADELAAAVAEEQDRIHPALQEFVSLSGELLKISDEWRASHEEYEASRPKNRLVRALRLPPVEIRRSEGRIQTSVDLTRKPEQGPLSEAGERQLRALAAGTAELPSTLVAEVDTEGSVLLGPASVGDAHG